MTLTLNVHWTQILLNQVISLTFTTNNPPTMLLVLSKHCLFSSKYKQVKNAKSLNITANSQAFSLAFSVLLVKTQLNTHLKLELHYVTLKTSLNSQNLVSLRFISNSLEKLGQNFSQWRLSLPDNHIHLRLLAYVSLILKVYRKFLTKAQLVRDCHPVSFICLSVMMYLRIPTYFASFQSC